MTANFEVGDVVALISGGPAMTVAGWRDDPFGEPGWLCVWSIQGAIRRDTFPGGILRLYEPDTPKKPRSGPPKEASPQSA